MGRVAWLTAIAVAGCASGQDEAEVAFTVYDEVVTCDGFECLDEAGETTEGESLRAPAILSSAGSRLKSGLYLYVGATRADSRFVELEMDLPTGRTGTVPVEARMEEYLSGHSVYRSETSSGQVSLVLAADPSRPPAGRFDLLFRDAAGAPRRVIGGFARAGYPQVDDGPVVGDSPRTDGAPEPRVVVDYEPRPDWDVYVDEGCAAERTPGPEPEPAADAGGCEGDAGGDDYGDEGGCEGDAGGDDYGDEGGCEGDSGGESYESDGGCEGDGGGEADCSVGGQRRLSRRDHVTGRLLPYAIVSLGLAARRRRR